MAKASKFLRGSQISKELRSSIASAETVKIAVAFLKEGGYKEIERELKQALDDGKTVQFIVGACSSYHITDPQVLLELKQLERNYRNLELGCFRKGDFHPKLFIFIKRENVKVILGSSNLTSGGTGSNIEANILVEGTNKEQLIRGILDFFDNEILATSFILTDDYIQYYSRIFETIERNFKTINKQPVPRLPTRSAPKTWKDYPHPYRKLSPREREEIRKNIARTDPDDWEPILCITLAEKYDCSAYQIRGTKARVHHASSWTHIRERNRTATSTGPIATPKRRYAILWSTNPGDHIRIHREVINSRKATLWGVDFKVSTKQYEFPLTGYLYINGDSVKYRAKIASIETYRDKQKSKEDYLRPKEYRDELHRTYLKLAELTPLRTPRSVSDFTKLNGKKAEGGQAMRNHIRIVDPVTS